MNLKQRPGDFRVHERLRPAYLREAGEHRVYRVRKRKLTSLDAAAELAREAGVPPAEVGLAGLKDRQGITVQYMSVRRGPAVRIERPELSVETAGFAERPLTSEESLGNDFDITVRGLTRAAAKLMAREAEVVARWGLVNYFDEQRFGNLEHGQGWIVRDLFEGRVERALQRLLTASSASTPERERRLRQALRRSWGDWRACRDIAGKLGAHHSVFEHLGRQPEDFAGAFARVSRRLRLIHLYAFQSHLWNRAVVRHLRWSAGRRRLISTPGPEGPFVFYAERSPESWSAGDTFPLAGPGLDGVRDPAHRRAYELVLEREKLRAADLRGGGIGGFQLKAEERALLLAPRDLEVSAPVPDTLQRGRLSLELRFGLGRGSYASLVVKRLMARGGARRGALRAAGRPGARPHDGEALSGNGPRGRDEGARSGYAARPSASRSPGGGRSTRETSPGRGRWGRPGREPEDGGPRRATGSSWKTRNTRRGRKPGSSG